MFVDLTAKKLFLISVNYLFPFVNRHHLCLSFFVFRLNFTVFCRILSVILKNADNVGNMDNVENSTTAHGIKGRPAATPVVTTTTANHCFLPPSAITCLIVCMVVHVPWL